MNKSSFTCHVRWEGCDGTSTYQVEARDPVEAAEEAATQWDQHGDYLCAGGHELQIEVDGAGTFEVWGEVCPVYYARPLSAAPQGATEAG